MSKKICPKMSRPVGRKGPFPDSHDEIETVFVLCQRELCELWDVVYEKCSLFGGGTDMAATE